MRMKMRMRMRMRMGMGMRMRFAKIPRILIVTAILLVLTSNIVPVSATTPTGSPTLPPSPYVSISDTLTCGSQSTESLNCVDTQYPDCSGNPAHGEIGHDGVDLVNGFVRHRLWSVRTPLITYTTGHLWSDVCGVPSCTLPSEAFATECLAACVAGGFTECGIQLLTSNYQCYGGSGTMS